MVQENPLLIDNDRTHVHRRIDRVSHLKTKAETLEDHLMDSQRRVNPCYEYVIVLTKGREEGNTSLKDPNF